MTTHDPRAWRVAIAIGLESGLDWARWASGLTRPRPFWPDPNNDRRRALLRMTKRAGRP